MLPQLVVDMVAAAKCSRDGNVYKLFFGEDPNELYAIPITAMLETDLQGIQTRGQPFLGVQMLVNKGHTVKYLYDRYGLVFVRTETIYREGQLVPGSAQTVLTNIAFPDQILSQIAAAAAVAKGQLVKATDDNDENLVWFVKKLIKHIKGDIGTRVEFSYPEEADRIVVIRSARKVSADNYAKLVFTDYGVFIIGHNTALRNNKRKFYPVVITNPKEWIAAYS